MGILGPLEVEEVNEVEEVEEVEEKSLPISNLRMFTILREEFRILYFLCLLYFLYLLYIMGWIKIL
jgi:hypothetical protein